MRERESNVIRFPERNFSPKVMLQNILQHGAPDDIEWGVFVGYSKKHKGMIYTNNRSPQSLAWASLVIQDLAQRALYGEEPDEHGPGPSAA